MALLLYAGAALVRIERDGLVGSGNRQLDTPRALVVNPTAIREESDREDRSAPTPQRAAAAVPGCP